MIALNVSEVDIHGIERLREVSNDVDITAFSRNQAYLTGENWLARFIR